MSAWSYSLLFRNPSHSLGHTTVQALSIPCRFTRQLLCKSSVGALQRLLRREIVHLQVSNAGDSDGHANSRTTKTGHCTHKERTLTNEVCGSRSERFECRLRLLQPELHTHF